MGVPYDIFWHLSPTKLQSFYKAEIVKRKQRDEENWLLGMYFAHALDSTVCNAFLWRKKGSKPHQYLDKPFLQRQEKKAKYESKPLTEEEKKNKRKIYF